MTETTGFGEDLEVPLATEGVDLDGHRLFEVAQIALGLLTAEQVVRGVAAAGEKLVGHLAPDQLVGGQSEAGLVLGEAVEATDARGREQTQQAVTGHVDHEGVAPGGAPAGQVGGGITQEPPHAPGPGQRSAGPRGHRMDLGRGRPGTGRAYRRVPIDVPGRRPTPPASW